MCRKPLSRFAIAAVLVLSLLLPSAAAARGPAHASTSHLDWGALPGGLWDLLLQLFGPTPHLKNGIQIDPDGFTVTPASPATSWTIRPDGLKNRSQIDPDGAPAAPAPPRSDNGIQIDPNG